jgi:hypothetical protein
VRYLGVRDTVMALGSRFASTEESTSSPGRTFYPGTAPAECVEHARQALAIDERRFDFRLEIWTEQLLDQTMEQRWFAGVHSDPLTETSKMLPRQKAERAAAAVPAGKRRGCGAGAHLNDTDEEMDVL